MTKTSSDITLSNASVTRIAREYNLQPGSYWTASKDVYDEDRVVISAGRMHMLAQIKTADDAAHSIVLRHHPSERGGDYILLLREFLDCFIPEKNPDAVRAAEIREIEQAILGEQAAIESLSNDPAAVLGAIEADRVDNPDSKLLDGYDEAAGLPRLDSDAHNEGIQAVSQAQLDAIQAQAGNRHTLLSARSALIERHASKLQALATSITPFHIEKAEAVSAQARAIVKEAKKVFEGLHTLELYTGKNVSLYAIHEGPLAAPDLPYALRQRVLFMDEESLIHLEYDGADFKDFDEFAELLVRDTDLRDRLLPEQRCIVAMRYRRYSKQYGSSPANILLNEENRRVFLLVRDGERLTAVFSPLDYFRRLFPTQDDLDRPFRGMAGDSITLDDVRYADRKADVELGAQMYKRLLILLWGLYDRTDLLGPFEAEQEHGHLNLLSFDAQDHAFRFISDDDDSTTLGAHRVSLNRFYTYQNTAMRSGSLVAGDWNSQITPQSAPNCYTNSIHHEPDQRLEPVESAGIAHVGTRNARLTVSIATQKRYAFFGEQKSGQSQLTLKWPRRPISATNGILVLDGLIASDIHARIYSSEARRHYQVHLPLLIAAHRELLRRESDATTLIDEVVANSACSRAHATRAVMFVIAGRRWPEIDALSKTACNEIPGQAASIAAALACCDMPHDLRPLTCEPGERLPHSLTLLASTEHHTPLLRVALSHDALLVLYHAAAKPADSKWPGSYPWVERRVTSLVADGAYIQPTRQVASCRELIAERSAIELTIWERREPKHATSPDAPPWHHEPENESAIDVWVNRGANSPTDHPADIEAMMDEAVAGSDFMLRLVSGALSPLEIERLLDRAENELMRDMQRASRLVEAPSFSTPIAIGRQQHRYFGRDWAFCWIEWSADAITLIHRIGNASIRERVRARISRTYNRSDRIIDSLADKPIGSLRLRHLSSKKTQPRIHADNNTIGSRGNLGGDIKAFDKLSIDWSVYDEKALREIAAFSTDDAAVADLIVPFFLGESTSHEKAPSRKGLE